MQQEPTERMGWGSSGSTPPFLAIWFRCCHAYGRLYRDIDGRMYQGRCPRCGCSVHAMIGSGGTNRRIFQAG